MTASIETLLAKFHPHVLEADTSGADDAIRAAIPHLVEAMRGIDTLYHQQMGEQVLAFMAEIANAGPDEPRAIAAKHFNGPYNKLDHGKPFVDGVPEALPGKALYPADLTEEELDQFIATHPAQKESLLSPTTVVARDGKGLKATAYHEAYSASLRPVADALYRAAEACAPSRLSDFIKERANTLLGKVSYQDSDASWVRFADAPLEVVIGPFEVYEDRFKGVKAFYEGMLLLRNEEACAHLREIESHVGDLAAVIPTPEGSRPAMGGMAPMIVADELIATGEGYAGILASAFNLPNDPWVREKVGWKQIMIRNVMQAKFDTCTRAIAERILGEQTGALSFDAYFYFVLLHEVSHGLGPAYRADGRSTNEACGKHYTALEEAKADIGSLVLLLTKGGQYGIPQIPPDRIAATFFAGLYRSARFGLHEAHGKANVVEYSFLQRAGAIDGSGKTDRILPEALPDAAIALLNRLCSLQAAGTDVELEEFLADYGSVPERLESAIDSLSDVPIDIRPAYTV